MNPFLHTTDLFRLMDCPRLAWLNHEHALPPVTYANSGDSFKDCTNRFLQLENAPCGQVGDTTDRSLEILQEHGYGRHLRLEAQGVRTNLPMLAAIGTLYQFEPMFIEFQKEASPYGYYILDYKPDESPKDLPKAAEKIASGDSLPYWKRKYALVYPHMSKTPGAHDLALVKLNSQIARECGIDIVHHQVIGINPSYTRGEMLEPEQLLVLSSHAFKKPGSRFAKSIDQQLKREPADLATLAAKAKEVLYAPLPEPKKCRACMAPRHCAMQEDCFDASLLEDDHTAFLFSSRQKKRLEEQGITHIGDLGPEEMDGFSLQYAQMQAAKTGRPFVDKQAVRRWIEGLQWPLTYLDFEWDTYAIPPYARMQPFDVLCFQYSMHVEQKDGSLKHSSFFMGGDCRAAFIESLINGIPKEGSIVVYNMEGAEKLRLMQLARQFPQYEAELEQIWMRMVDLSSLFEHGAYYDLMQRGRFSLKSVLPLFDENESYASLDVKDGLQAIAAYREHEACRNPQRKEEIARSISEYCAMDTMAEVIILHGLMQAAKE